MRLQAVILRGAAKGIERERLFRNSQSWNTARLVMKAYHDPKRFPSFDEFCRPARQRSGVRGDWRAMKAQALNMVAASGGKVITR